MKFIKDNLTSILFAILVGVIVWNVRGCTTKAPPNEELIIAKEQIKSIEKTRKADSLIMVEKLKLKDMEIELAKQKDTVLVKQIIQSNDKLKKIPATVDNLTKSELRRAFTDY